MPLMPMVNNVPDWQQGPPVIEQRRKHPWWALDLGLNHLLIAPPDEVSSDILARVTRSAPVTESWEDGITFVSMESAMRTQEEQEKADRALLRKWVKTHATGGGLDEADQDRLLDLCWIDHLVLEDGHDMLGLTETGLRVLETMWRNE